MEEDLIQRLLADAGLKGLVKDRIYWLRRPQKSPLPAIVLTRITPGQSYTMKGRETLSDPIIQMDCRAGSFTEALKVRRALIRALDGLTTDPFKGAFIEGGGPDRVDDAAGPAAGSSEIHQTSLDVRVWHSQA